MPARDAVGLILLRCAETGTVLLGVDRRGMGRAAGPGAAQEFAGRRPAWAGRRTVRPYVAAHAYLLGGFTAFHRLGQLQPTDAGLAGLRA